MSRFWSNAIRTCLISAVLVLSNEARPVAIVHVIISKPFKSRHAKGLALGPSGGAMGGVRVRVFDHPEYLFDTKTSWVEAEKRRHKLREQITKADGMFSFALPRGEYEIRLTKDDQGFNPLSFVVVIGRKYPQQESCVFMQPEGGFGGRVEPCDMAHPPQ